MEILYGLCAPPWAKYILDGVVLIFFVVMALIGGKKGFINWFFGIISTVVALLLAITLAKALLVGTNGLFGLEDWFAKKFGGGFAKINGFDADISASGVEAALKEHDVSAVLSRLVIKMVGVQTELAPGTTLAQLLGDSTATLAATLLCGVILFIAAKLLMRIVRKILNAVAEKISLVGGVNTLLGSVFGFLQALLIVSVVLALLALLPFESLSSYLSSTLLVGIIYENNPLIYVLAFFL